MPKNDVLPESSSKTLILQCTPSYRAMLKDQVVETWRDLIAQKAFARAKEKNDPNLALRRDEIKDHLYSVSMFIREAIESKVQELRRECNLLGVRVRWEPSGNAIDSNGKREEMPPI